MVGYGVFFLPPPLSLDKSHHLPPPRPAHKSAAQEPDLSCGISQTLQSCCRSSHPSQKAHLPPQGVCSQTRLPFSSLHLTLSFPKTASASAFGIKKKKFTTETLKAI